MSLRVFKSNLLFLLDGFIDKCKENNLTDELKAFETVRNIIINDTIQDNRETDKKITPKQIYYDLMMLIVSEYKDNIENKRNTLEIKENINESCIEFAVFNESKNNKLEFMITINLEE